MKMTDLPKCECGATRGLFTDGGRSRCPACVCKERDELRAIVDKLPKTADGVPVVPGRDFVYWRYDSEGRRWHVLNRLMVLPVGGGASEPLSECYSTREAAEAAKAEGK